MEDKDTQAVVLQVKFLFLLSHTFLGRSLCVDYAYPGLDLESCSTTVMSHLVDNVDSCCVTCLESL